MEVLVQVVQLQAQLLHSQAAAVETDTGGAGAHEELIRGQWQGDTQASVCI